jgi:hypothetical protein
VGHRASSNCRLAHVPQAICWHSAPWHRGSVLLHPSCGACILHLCIEPHCGLFPPGQLRPRFTSTYCACSWWVHAWASRTMGKSLAWQAWAQSLACVHVHGFLLVRQAGPRGRSQDHRMRRRQVVGTATWGAESFHKSPPPYISNHFRTWVWLASIFAQPSPNGAAGNWLVP